MMRPPIPDSDIDDVAPFIKAGFLCREQVAAIAAAKKFAAARPLDAAAREAVEGAPPATPRMAPEAGALLGLIPHTDQSGAQA